MKARKFSPKTPIPFSGKFYGQITVTNRNGSTVKPIFDPEPDKYEVIDRCSGYRVVDAMPIKEIYDQYGTKLQDAPVVNGKLDISQSGSSGDIRIIRVVVNGENISKIVVKD